MMRGRFELTVQELIAQSVEDLADEDGYAYLGDLGTLLIKRAGGVPAGHEVRR